MELTFERAEWTGEPPPFACGVCKQPISDAYHAGERGLSCGACAAAAEHARMAGWGVGRFVRAAWFGAIASVACAVLYFLLRAVVGSLLWPFAIIITGVMVGGAVYEGSHGRGGWRYGLLAVLITFLAVSTFRVPDIEKSARFRGVHLEAYLISLATPFVLLTRLDGIMVPIIYFWAIKAAWDRNPVRERLFIGPFRVGRLPAAAPPPPPPPPQEATGA